MRPSERVDRAWQAIDIYTAAQALKTFATGVLPSHWMEMSKSRLYDGDPAATFVIHRIVRDMMTAFCPVIPFFTHHISFTLYGTSALDRRSFPNQSDAGGHDLGPLTSAIMDFNSMVWKTKKETGIALNAPIGGIQVPSRTRGLRILPSTDAPTRMSHRFRHGTVAPRYDSEATSGCVDEVQEAHRRAPSQAGTWLRGRPLVRQR